MPNEDRLGQSFDLVAALYDEVRPGYPEPIIDALAEHARLTPTSHILEIGCGTGQITRPLARRGHSILALEPGPALAALASANLRAYPAVHVLAVAFEDWPVQPAAFDLALSAQAFHWIEPAFGLARAAEALKPGGAIGLVWHIDRSEHSDFYLAARPIYARFLPSEAQRNNVDTLEQHVRRYHNALHHSSLFTSLRELRHRWQQRYSASQYLKLLHTFSNHQSLPEPAKSEFFQAIEAELARFPDGVLRTYETLLLVAYKASTV